VKGLAERTWQQVRIVSQDTLVSIDSLVNDLARMPGSPLLLLVSSGFLAGTLERDEDQVINHALRAGVVINALDGKCLYAEAPVRPFDQPQEEPELPVSTFQFEVSASLDRLWAVAKPLASFAQSIGGLFFHNNNDLAFGFRELAAMPEVSYVLTFRPDDADATGRYHKLRVRCHGPGGRAWQRGCGQGRRPGSGAHGRVVHALFGHRNQRRSFPGSAAGGFSTAALFPTRRF
jgi:VWFA-related protein